MNSLNQKLFITLFVADIILLLVVAIFFDIKILYNTQIAYIGATLVMLATFVSYRRMVRTGVAHTHASNDEDRDVIDKIEDPYDLYSEQVEKETKELAEVIKEEKKALKESRRTVFQTLKDTKAALSFYRLGAYTVLILGFLYLQRHALLSIPAYLFALGLPFVLLVSVLLSQKENHSHD